MMSRIAIDMDEVLADTFTKQLNWLETFRNIKIDRNSCHGKPLKATTTLEDYEALYRAMKQPDFFADIPVMSGAKEVMKQLAVHHELYIVTAAMEFPFSFNAKFNWLAEHFPYIRAEQIVFCGDKSIIHADYMLDDSPIHLSKFIGKQLLFSASHNLNEQRFKRMLHWEDVSTLLIHSYQEEKR